MTVERAPIPRFYKDMVEYHDKVIGRLLDYLAEQGLSEDTLVIYTGDNGSPQEVCSSDAPP